MKIKNKKLRYLAYGLITLVAIFGIAFLSLVAYVENGKKESQEKTHEEQLADADTDTAEDTESTQDYEDTEDTTEEDVTIEEEAEPVITPEEQQIYASFYPSLKAHTELYDKAWEEVWAPAIEMANSSPSVAVDTLIIVAASYEKQAKEIRALSFPAELDPDDASSFGLATDYFAQAMEERHNAAVFAAAAIKSGTFNEQITADFIKKCSDRADSKLIDAAATFVDLSTKYGYTP